MVSINVLSSRSDDALNIAANDPNGPSKNNHRSICSVKVQLKAAMRAVFPGAPDTIISSFVEKARRLVGGRAQPDSATAGLLLCQSAREDG